MLRNFRFVFLTLFLYFTVSVFPTSTFAIENFDAVYNVVYDIEEDTNAKATINVALTNTTDRYYADSYALQIGFSDIENVKATDPDGQLAPKITKNENGQKIEVTFNRKVVGKGNTLNFTLSFDTPNVTQKKGKIWEINVPGIANPDEFKDFNVEIKPPFFLENPIYIKPEQGSKELKFTKEQLGKSGISMAFGEQQIYDFNIKYHLKNDNIFPIKRQIAIPPTTNYQDIFIEKIYPKPLNVTIDTDGNWIAEYALSPTQRIDIEVAGKVELSLKPKKEPLSREDFSKYLTEQRYWEVADQDIKKLAADLKTPENIYKYVVENLKYDFSRVNTDQKRLGAAQVLSEKEKAVCLEFTDLFVAITRAAGIPAREINGYAVTENTKQRPLSLIQDILHAWPEYYDVKKETWVMVDPTWGNTTGGIDYFNVFDMDHIVFVRKGVGSTSPAPGGDYKLAEDDYKKDVTVVVSEAKGDKKEKYTLESLFGKVYAAQLPINGKIEMTNIGQVMIQDGEATVYSNRLSPKFQVGKINPLPPYGKQEINIAFDGMPLLTNDDHEFTMNVKGVSENVRFRIAPFNLTIDRLLIFVYVVMGAIIIWAAAQGAWRLFVHKRKK